MDDGFAGYKSVSAVVLRPRGRSLAAGAVIVFVVDMSLVISAVGNSSFHCVWEYIAEDFQEYFTRVCCFICLKT
jgi:hypothetical protein